MFLDQNKGKNKMKGKLQNSGVDFLKCAFQNNK